MKKVLIGVVGRNLYQETIYNLDGFKKKTNFVSDILNEKFKFDEIYIIGTTESGWDLVNKKIKNYKKIVIPYGKNYDEFWEIFGILSKLDVKNKEVYFDVTHGFRSIPLFISSILNFFEKVKNAKIKGVYYGIFEAKENDITPIINILPLLEMNKFVDAFYIFKNYADGREISKIIKEKFNEIDNSLKRNYGRVRQLADELNFYSQSVGLSAVQPYIDSLSKIDEIISNIDKIPVNLKAIEFLISDLQKESEIFKNLDKFYKKMLKASHILFEKNRYAQAITILRETIPTYVLEELGFDHLNKDLRENKVGDAIKKKLYFSKEFLKLVDKIRTLRNNINHAFFSENSGETTIKNAVENLREYIKEFEKLTNEDKVILKKDELKTFLKESR